MNKSLSLQPYLKWPLSLVEQRRVLEMEATKMSEISQKKKADQINDERRGRK
jgi:hypothetical protein